MNIIIFYSISIAVILFAIGILITRKVLYTAYLLSGILLCLAVLYLLMGAEFLAAVQILLYVGGILVLIIFSLMLTKRNINGDGPRTGTLNMLMSLLVGFFFFVIAYAVINSFSVSDFPWMADRLTKGGTVVTLPSLGKVLMINNLVPFEIAAIVLLVAFVGAAEIASKRVEK
jgi:NADH-quinone oxidoreductase subunit J